MAAECLAAFCGDVLVHVGEWLGDTGSPAFEQALAQPPTTHHLPTPRPLLTTSYSLPRRASLLPTAPSEQALARDWRLEERVPLPCWGDTADDLTVWRRRASAPAHGAPAILALALTPRPSASASASASAASSPSASPGAPAPIAAGQHPVLCCDTCGKRGGLRPPAPGGEHTCVLRRCAYCRVACYCSEACAAAGREAHDHQHQLRMIHFARPLDFKSNDYGACC